MLRTRLFSLVVLGALTVALLSLSYPSVTISTVSIQPATNLTTYTNQYMIGYQHTSASTYQTGYSTFTAWYPGDPVCDPASNACTPYPTPTATVVYPQSTTNLYVVTQESATVTTYTSEYTALSIQTSFQNAPPYAAAGLTGFQFGIAAMAVVTVVALTLLLTGTKQSAVVPERKSDTVRGIRFCQQCGAEGSSADKFCSKCGAQLE
jgi:hypothetical protein